jgi:hypothetical protein
MRPMSPKTSSPSSREPGGAIATPSPPMGAIAQSPHRQGKPLPTSTLGNTLLRAAMRGLLPDWLRPQNSLPPTRRPKTGGSKSLRAEIRTTSTDKRTLMVLPR